jgi:iron complex outermembrane receptor protein
MVRVPRKTLLAAAICSVLSATAFAQEEQTMRTIKAVDEADPLITQTRETNVGKTGVSVFDTPFSITVVDVEQIRDTGAKNVQDVLLYSSGVYAGRYGFDTRGDWAAIRGLGPSSYIDGLRGSFGFYNNVRPDIYMLSTVEVLKGPSSALYGQSDLGGIVNVVSKRPQAAPLREVELQYGSHNRKQIGADITGAIDSDDKLLYRLVAVGRESDTQVDFANDDAVAVMPSFTWQPAEGTKITALFVHQQNESKVSAQFLPSKGTLDAAPLGQIPINRFVGEPNWDRYDTSKNEFTLILDQRLSETWQLSAIARQTNSTSETREIWATVGEIPTDTGYISRTVHSADRKTDVLAADVRVAGVFNLGPTVHQVTVGVDYQDALWEEYNYFYQGGVGSFNLYNPNYGSLGGLDLNALPLTDRPDNKIVQTGVYAMDHITWGQWIAQAALRYDEARNETLNLTTPDAIVKNTATTGRIGVMYQFENGIAPFVSFSNAFVPNLGTDGTSGPTAPSYLKPTTGDQKEAGVKFLANGGNTSAAVAWFDITQKNRIVDGATPGGREQVGASTQGWELELQQRIGGLQLTANYAQLDAINEVTGLRISSIPEESASAWARYFFASGLRVGFGARYTGDVTGNAGAPIVPSVSQFDAMVGYSVGGFDVRLDAKNLTDEEYVSWCRGLNQDCGYGEALTVGLTGRYRF